MTASISRAGIGSGSQLRSRHSFGPWNMPQSTSTWNPPVLMRCLEPVTVPAAPKNCMYVIRSLQTAVFGLQLRLRGFDFSGIVAAVLLGNAAVVDGDARRRCGYGDVRC